MRKFLAGLLVALAAVSTHAQETRGTIAGTVRDEQGVIPGAIVEVTNVLRMFPFRVDGVRENRMQILTMNVRRVIPFGRGRSLQLRVDVVNALNDEQLLAPNLDPTSTQSAWSPTPRTPWGGGSRS